MGQKNADQPADEHGPNIPPQDAAEARSLDGIGPIEPDSREARRRALSACVSRMKAHGLTGKPRDDAAAHFLAGVAAATGAPMLADDARYVDVLEALAD